MSIDVGEWGITRDGRPVYFDGPKTPCLIYGRIQGKPGDHSWYNATGKYRDAMYPEDIVEVIGIDGVKRKIGEEDKGDIMNFIPGKHYRTAEPSNLMYIGQNDDPNSTLGDYIFAEITENGYFKGIRSYYENGRYRQKEKSKYDIIGKWIDKPEKPDVDWDKLPPGILSVAFDKSGDFCGYLDNCRIRMDTNCWSPEKDYSGIYGMGFISFNPDQCLRKEYTGDWKNSKVIRPGYEDKLCKS